MNIASKIQKGVVTLGLALSLTAFLTLPALAQSTASEVPGIKTLTGITGSASGPTSSSGKPLGSDVTGDSDIFTRANTENQDLAFMKSMWTLTRRLTNVMVVVFLFIAAAATTLNFQVSNYGIKKTLPSVLLATVYANFSYAIAKIMNSVDMSFMKAFVGSGSGDGKGASAMGIMAHFIKGPLDGWWAKIVPGADWTVYLSALFALAVLGMLAVGLLFLVLLFFIRNYILAMLIAVSPVAFMTLAMPFTQSFFKKWWDQFIKWMFFPAIAGFWLYLGAVALTAAGVSGGFIGMVMAGLILWMAIRTPFTLGSGVAAAAGFITGYATRGVGMARQGAAATGRGVGALTRPGRDYINSGIQMRFHNSELGRMYRRATSVNERRQARLAVIRGGSNSPSAETLRNAQAAANVGVGIRGVYARVSNWRLQRAARHTVGYEEETERIGSREQIRKGDTKNYLYSRDGEAREDDVRNKQNQTRIDAELDAMKAEAEQDFSGTAEGRALGEQIASAQQYAETFKNNIEAINDAFKTLTLTSNDNLRLLRKVSEVNKTTQNSRYQEALLDLQKEIRETGTDRADELGRALLPVLQETIGANFMNGIPANQVAATTMAKYSGSRQVAEASLKGLQESEMSLEYEAMLRARNSFRNSSIAGLEDHPYDQATWLTQAGGQAAVLGDANIQDYFRERGLDHLSDQEKIQHLYEYTHQGNAAARRSERLSALKTLGRSNSENEAFLRKDASSVVRRGGMQNNNRIRAIRAIQMIAAGGSANPAVANLYETGHNGAPLATSRDRHVAQRERESAHGSLKANFGYLLDASSPSSFVSAINDFVGDGRTAGDVAELISEANPGTPGNPDQLPGLPSGDPVTIATRILQTPLSIEGLAAGERPVTLGRAINIINRNLRAPDSSRLDASGHAIPITHDELVKAAKTALIGRLWQPLQLGADSAAASGAT